MKKERYEYKQGVIGCEWAIISPIVVALIFSLIGAIYCKASGQSTDILTSNTVFKTFSSVAVELSFLLVALCIARRGGTNFVKGSGLNTVSTWWAYLGAIVISVAVLFLLNPIINCWQYMLTNAGYNGGSLPFTLDNGGLLVLGIVLFALLPALCEEILFRGLILNSLRKYGLCVSIGISALFFSLMHMSLLQLPYTFLLGIVLGLVVYFTRNLWLSIIMHFVNNSIVLIWGYFGNKTYNFVWYDILWGIGGLVLFSALLFVLYKLLNKFGGSKTLNKEQVFCDQEPTLPANVRRKMWIAPVLIAVACFIICILGGFGIL